MAKPYLRVTNWNRYQHYRNRKPVWIKFYVDILYDPKLLELPVPTRLLWDQMLLLAAERGNVIPNDPELVAKLVRIEPRDVHEGIQELLKGRWLSETTGVRRASKPASKASSLEKEKENKDLTVAEEKPTPIPTRKKCPRCSLMFGPRALVDHMRNVHDEDVAA